MLCACTQFQFDIVTTHKFVRVYLLFFLSIHVSLSLSLCSFVSLSVCVCVSLSLSVCLFLCPSMSLTHSYALSFALPPCDCARTRVRLVFLRILVCVRTHACATEIEKPAPTTHQHTPCSPETQGQHLLCCLQFVVQFSDLVCHIFAFSLFCFWCFCAA